MSDRIPDLMIERLAKGELSAQEATRVRTALGADADARLQAIAADDAATLERLPPERVARIVRARLADDRARSSTPRWWIPMTALAAASLAVWCAVRPGGGGELLPDGGAGEGGVLVDPSGDVVRIKGDAAITIDRLAGARIERLDDGARVRAGDRLQLQYRAGDRAHGAIVSIDGAGTATLHFPSTVHGSTRLRAGGLVALDHSYELDAAPSFERFFFVTTDASTVLDVALVLDAAKTLAASNDAEHGTLDLPATHECAVIRLDKQ